MIQRTRIPVVTPTEAEAQDINPETFYQTPDFETSMAKAKSASELRPPTIPELAARARRYQTNLEAAVIDLCDSFKNADEIQARTGVSASRAQEIWSLFDFLLKGK